MKKKLTGILMCLMMVCMSVLAGCSLVEPNYDQYYNQSVVVLTNTKTNETYEISKRDLWSSYQSYGYTYEQHYGYSREEAIKTTLELLENRKITLIAAEEKFGIKPDGTGLDKKEKAYFYQQVVDSLRDNLNNYYNTIIGQQESSDDSDEIKFNGYKKNATLGSDLTIHKVNFGNQLLSDFNYNEATAKDFNDPDDYKLIYENLIDSLINDNYKKAFTKYFNNLRAYEYGMGLSTDAKFVFDREIQRLYKVLYENYVIEKYTQENRNLESESSVTATQIVSLYSSKVRGDYTQYVIEQDSAYDSDVQKSLNDTYYFKDDSDSTKFFTVANVLFKFTDEQQKEFDGYKEKYQNNDGGYSYQEYLADIEKVYNKVVPVVRKYDAETKTYNEVKNKNEENPNVTIYEAYNVMKTRLAQAQLEGNVNKVGDVINDFIYEYNEDTGMINATNNYVIGIDKDGNVVSSFVEEFNNASIELYKKGDAKVGDISGFVRTDYGIHVIIYTGACENLFNGVDSSFELNDQAINLLSSTRVNVLVDKTYFDVLYDEIYADNSQYYDNIHLNYLREDYVIQEYSGRYADLLG